MKKMKVFSVMNSKGGVGKSTTLWNLAVAKAMEGKKVLMVDCDSQGTLSDFCGIDKDSEDFKNYSLSKIFLSRKYRDKNITTKSCIYSVDILDDIIEKKFPKAAGKLFVIPTNPELDSSENNVYEHENIRYGVLKKLLSEVENDYDYCFIDCPSKSTLITNNAICASDQIIFPTEAEDSSIDGINRIFAEINELKEDDFVSDSLRYGVVVTKAQLRTRYHKKVISEIDGEIEILGVIKYCITVQESQGEKHAPIVITEPKNEVSINYKEIAKKLK